MLQMTAKDMHY